MAKLDIIYGPGAESSPDAKRVADMLARDYDELMSILAKFSANSNWAMGNRESLRKDYGDMYIAVRDEKVCASHQDISELVEIIEKQYGDAREIFVDYIPKRDVGFLLAQFRPDVGASAMRRQ